MRKATLRIAKKRSLFLKKPGLSSHPNKALCAQLRKIKILCFLLTWPAVAISSVFYIIQIELHKKYAKKEIRRSQLRRSQ